MLFDFGMDALMGAVRSADAAQQSAGFFSQWLAGLNIGAIVLLLVGTALLVFEMLVPGFGAAGFAGAAAVAAGLVIGSKTFGAAMFSLALVAVVLIAAAPFAFKMAFGRKKHPNRLVLEDSMAAVPGGVPSADAQELIGREGTAVTALRPSGIAVIDGRRLDVLAEGEFIAKGAAIVVRSVGGTRIGVEAAAENGKAAKR